MARKWATCSRSAWSSGFKFLKMDVGIQLLKGIPGTIIAPPDMLETRHVMHPFTGIQVTQKGIDVLCDYVGKVRDVIGYEIPLAVDHFGHIGVESCIRLGKALDQFTLAWYEDMIPWQFTNQWRTLTDAVDTPTCTGEDIYLKEGFLPLLTSAPSASSIPTWQPPAAFWRPKKIGDLAQEYGVAMAMHMAASPICALANVHCAAATENFVVLENHSVDDPRWSNLISGLPSPLIKDGFIQVPETPGLGFTDINLDLIREFLDDSDPDFFGPSDHWDKERWHKRLWS